MVDRVILYASLLASVIRPPNKTNLTLLCATIPAHWFFSKSYVLGMRWQVIPSYCAIAVSICGGNPLLSAVLGLLGFLADTAIPEITLDSGVIKGEHSVGYFDYEILNTKELLINENTNVSTSKPAIGRIFYPTKVPHNITSSYFFQNDRHGLTRRFVATSGIWNLIPQMPSWILSHWSKIQIPVSLGAEPLDKKMPVIVFSHGNTASRELSTTMALSLASSGEAVVVLVEHTDCSSSLARFSNGDSIEFDHSVGKLGNDPETIEFLNARRSQTRIRSQNIRDSIAFLWHINQGTKGLSKYIVSMNDGSGGSCSSRISRSSNGNCTNNNSSSCLLSSFSGRLNLQEIGVGGHSFGGATALTYAAEAINGRIVGPASKCNISGLFVMDPANSWIPDEVRLDVGLGVKPDVKYYWKKNMNASPSPPLLSQKICTMFMYSEFWWSVDKWSQYGKEFIKSSSFSNSLYIVIQGCGHQSLCDMAILLPNFLNVKLMKNTLPGYQSKDLLPVINTVLLKWLNKASVLKNDTQNHDMRHLNGTTGVIIPDSGTNNRGNGIRSEL
jgi:platelet-activating factor acetylhydrolase